MLLPKPYADEIIGSTLLRGCRRLGLQSKRLSPLLRGGSTAAPSPFLPSCIREIAEATGMPAREILHKHTVFPYVTAFLENGKSAALEKKILGNLPSDNACFAALQRQAAVPYLRGCSHCIREELKLYGESYWHRSHLLPGVHICSKHGTQLWEASTLAKGLFKMTLPNEAKHLRYVSPLTHAYLAEIAHASEEILNDIHTWPRTAALRTLALEKNYCIGKHEIPAAVIVADVLRFYGETFLSEVRCEYSHKRSPWPALILRTSAPELAPMKYLLMGIYLRSCTGLDADSTREKMGYQRPGPRTDFGALEQRAISTIQKRIAVLVKTQKRTTVRALLHHAGVWESYKHNRVQFPALAALLFKFKASDQSERQIGKRLRWRKGPSAKGQPPAPHTPQLP